MYEPALSYIHPESNIRPLKAKTDIGSQEKINLPRIQRPLKPTWAETEQVVSVKRTSNFDPVNSLASLIPTHSLFPLPETRNSRIDTPRKRTSHEENTPAKRTKVSSDPEESTEYSFSDAEHILRMIDDSLVDTPDKQLTPRIQTAAPVPSPKLAGPSYAYDTREYVQIFGALPPRPAWFQSWSRNLTPVKW